MARTLADARGWVQHGNTLCRSALTSLDDGRLREPSRLPGWTRAHVAAHLAANARALRNLVRWAATGTPTPMYASPQERAEGIERGALLSRPELVDGFDRSAAALEQDMDRLTGDQWSHEVVTAGGRTVAASETAWMRAREVLLHAVDLGASVEVADLPADFLRELGHDIVATRSGTPVAGSPTIRVRPAELQVDWSLPGSEPGPAVEVCGGLAAVAAYLAGRGDHDLTATRAGGPAPLPLLPAWL